MFALLSVWFGGFQVSLSWTGVVGVETVALLVGTMVGVVIEVEVEVDGVL